MRKQYLKHVFVFILLLFITIPIKSYAITPSDEYTIESYDIDMVVNEDNTFDITETINAHFIKERHRNI